MNETLFSITGSDIVRMKDLAGVTRLFRKLAYDVEDRLRMPFGDLELPGRLRDFIQNEGWSIYLLSNYDRLFQIYLFETTNLNLTPIKDVCQSFAKKQGDYLFLFTIDYTDIVFVNPLRRPGGVELRRLKVNTLREPYHTELQILNALALPAVDMNPFDIYDLHCEAFQKERVTDEFYKVYKQVFEDVKQALVNTRSSAQAHAFTQMLMNRLMLLYFVQKRGWLDHNSGFLKDFYEAYRRQSETDGSSFYEDYLAPLFFSAFNREDGAESLSLPDSVRQIFTTAPYLNGGMFVRSDDIDSAGIHVPDSAFERMFERLFERYNFTVREDTPLDIELAIDPELLGNVYQRIIGEEERGLSGLFYTQPTEVNFMCQRAVIEYLARHISGKRRDIMRLVMNFLEPPDEMDLPWDRIEQLLSDVKICDVACGSGAFLVAMLHLLVDLRTLVRKRMGLTTDAFQLKKEIISKNLYGADVKAHAVRIAELRLWLSLVVDAPDDFVEKNENEPILPNLSYRLRQGDSLTEEFAGVPLHLRGEFDATGKGIPQIIQKIYDLERKIFDGKVKSSEIAGLKSEHRKLERELLQGILKDRMESVRAQIRKHKQNLEKPRHIQQGLFGAEPEQLQIDFEKTFRKETEKKIAALEQTHGEYARLLESEDFGKLNERDYVLWEIDFAEVFISKGGFDIIIGNPPYVRQEEIGPPTIVDRPTTRDERNAYKEKLIRSVQAFLGRDVRIDKKSDLYVYFYYLGMSLLNREGTFVFITSNSWLDVGYGAGLQEWLLRNMDVIDVYDNQAKRSFRSADVNTVICIFNKPEDDPLSHQVRFTAFRKPFEEVLSSDTLLAIYEAEGILSTDGFRVYQATQEKLLGEGLETDKTRDGTGKVSALMGTYKGNKWGGKYLRAPDIYFKILEEAGDRLVRLGDVAQVRRGITTGCNEFFYLDDEKAAEWGIEEEFLVPVIKSPRECSTIIIDPNTLPNKLFMCHKNRDELEDTQALAYIEWGESRGFHNRPSTRSRQRWWDVGIREFGKVLWPMIHSSRPVAFLNPEQAAVDHNLFEILTEDSLWAWFSLTASFTTLIRELYGRSNLGQGALKTEGIDIKIFPVMSPPLFSESNRNKVQALLQDISPHAIEAISPTGVNQSRRALDRYWLHLLGIEEDFTNELYQEVASLIEKRLARADNF